MRRPEELGEIARETALQEIIEEEEQRLGPFILPTAIEQIYAEWDADIEAEKQRIQNEARTSHTQV